LIAAAALGTAALASDENVTQPEIKFEEGFVTKAQGGLNEVWTYEAPVSERGWVTLVPSLGRGVEDFREDFGSTLAVELAQAGYSVLLIQPRGIGRSKDSLDPAEITMEALAQDIESVLNALEIDQVSLVGHAFGNRLSRYFAATRTGRVDKLVLLAAGGDFELSAEQQSCLFGSFNLAAPDETRLEAIHCAFFAQGQDPQIWLDGWYPALALAQVAAAQSVQSDDFKRAGGVPFLLVQPEQDFIAPPELAGRPLAEELGEQVTYVEIANAGHALLPEQPEKVAEVIIDYLGRDIAQ
jgi:pimeloyl-ACP methyl ester carboxylesterase